VRLSGTASGAARRDALAWRVASPVPSTPAGLVVASDLPALSVRPSQILPIVRHVIDTHL